jgi:hypothetical protein
MNRLLVVELDYIPNSYAGQRNYRIHNSWQFKYFNFVVNLDRSL